MFSKTSNTDVNTLNCSEKMKINHIWFYRQLHLNLQYYKEKVAFQLVCKIRSINTG